MKPKKRASYKYLRCYPGQVVAHANRLAKRGWKLHSVLPDGNLVFVYFARH